MIFLLVGGNENRQMQRNIKKQNENPKLQRHIEKRNENPKLEGNINKFGQLIDASFRPIYST